MRYTIEVSGILKYYCGAEKYGMVYNMDQTSVYIDMNPNTTIDFVGARHVDCVQCELYIYIYVYKLLCPSIF